MAESDVREEGRPSPDALLEVAAREKRGRLKIFLGAAPGVGKTYAMLEAARRRKSEGGEVLVGIVETHGRAETEAQIGDLEVLPRLSLPYKGHTLHEFDLDAALSRRPALILVDELAHTNAVGARHPKRYQDVEELLAAGIDVYTTLNVQHLESLNDVVAKITRVRVRETLPDEVLERADEIELIDLTSQELIKRLREGKVYVEGQARRAVAHFFQPGNITALRELALRRVAERVDEQMLDYMRQNAIVGPWPAGERLIACIGGDADASAVVRATRRLADQLHAPWTAAHVEMPGHERRNESQRNNVAEALRLAEHLGGEAVVPPGRDLVDELLRYAQSRNVTQIVIGRRRTSLIRRMLGRSLVEALMHRSGEIAVHVVPLKPAARDRAWERLLPPLAWRPYLWPVLYVAAAVCFGIGFEQVMALPSPQPFFFVAVLLAAVRHGLAASILASIVSFVAYNFFFIEPRHTLSVARPHEIIGLMLFLFAAVLVSGIAARARERAEDARRRVRTLGALYEFSRKLATAVGLDDLLWAACYQIASVAEGQAMALLQDKGDLRIAGSYPPEDDLDAGSWTAARWAFEKGEAAGFGTGTLPTLSWRFEPMRTSRGIVGVIGLRSTDGTTAANPERHRVIEALIDQTAVAVERHQLDHEIAEARVLASTEKLRHALLSSISHDLRTPLAAITGAVTSLKSFGTGYDPSVREDLMATIEEEAERLNRFVGNLLEMTRLEAGVLAPNRDWVSVDDLLAAAAARIRRSLERRRIRIDAGPGLPLLRIDFVLIEQVLFNLLDNAVKYSPDGSLILISAGVEGEMLVIRVTDQGRGIEAKDLPRIFDKFYRTGSGDSHIAGTGLGLPVCKGIVEAHGGFIRAASPAPAGYGTVVTVLLPIEPAPAMDRSA